MSNQERDSLVSKIEQLEQQQQVLAKYIATTKRGVADSVMKSDKYET